MLRKDAARDWWRAGEPLPVPDTPEMKGVSTPDSDAHIIADPIT